MTPPNGRWTRRAYPCIDDAWDQLGSYLGLEFDPALTDFEHCCEFVQAEFDALGPERFYFQSIGYLYELTHFHYSGHKDALFSVIDRAAHRLGLDRIADVGCGIGLDAEALIAAGHSVDLFDLASPSISYASARLGGRTNVHRWRTLDGAVLQGTYDLAYAVDVVEHVRRPAEFLDGLCRHARHVCVNLFGDDQTVWDEKDMHYPLDHRSLLERMAQRGNLIEVAPCGDTVVMLWEILTP